MVSGFAKEAADHFYSVMYLFCSSCGCLTS